ncbi:MAG: hypothetical protein HYY04_13920 [Chloroflexi bacterium]|nr:hypothetical protein [Chloroflexota bacterium]
MKVYAIDALTGLRAALEAPEGRRLDLFRERVMEPLRPFWEPWMRFMPGAPPAGQGDPAMDAARAFGYYEVRGYVFGDWSAEKFGHKRQGLPAFAGYTIGYRAVRAYLDSTGKSAAAATYVPWRDIVDGSRFW